METIDETHKLERIHQFDLTPSDMEFKQEIDIKEEIEIQEGVTCNVKPILLCQRLSLGI